ncbi:MAG: phospholipase D-like domain-containing protein [Bacteroidia bacterium]
MKNYQYARSVKLIYSGDDYFETLQGLIRKAKQQIHIQTYIFELDETGSSILSELTEAVKRGVTVNFLADGYGSRNISNPEVERIRKTGINFRLFSTFFSRESIYMGRRLHHKIVVADGNTALVGGINIANKYKGSANDPAWLDYSVLIEGNVCEELVAICESFFYKTKFSKPVVVRETEAKIQIRFLQNDWIRGRNQVHKAYRKALYIADRRIVFVASYFLPGYRFRKALKHARSRGVEIWLILAGKSDMPFLFFAEKYFYPFFLQNGFRIFEWNNSVMHGKAILVDKDWVTIGSYNMNPLSHYLSIELNAEIRNHSFAAEFQEHIETIARSGCREVKPAEQYGNFLSRLRNSIVYYFFKFIFLLFVSRKR